MEEIGKLAGHMRGVEDRLDLVNKEIYGNGRPGIRERLTRTEESVEQLTKDVAELKDLVSRLASSVGELAKALDKHVADDRVHTVKGLFLNKSIIPWLVLAFVVLHDLVEILPSAQELFRKLVGLP